MHWIKNSKNEPSASLTFAVIAFTITMIHMTLSIIVNPFGLAITPFNASEAMVVLTPIMALYFGRRFTDAKEKESELKHGKNITK